VKKVNQLIPSDIILGGRDPRDITVTGITGDSRVVGPGTLFFAVRGSKSDGHDFVANALAQGAAAVVIDRPEVLEKFPQAILVTSSRRALAGAAALWRDVPSGAFSVVGITGTNGKTTTTYLLKQMWEALGKTTGIIGTVECHIGNRTVPSTLTTPDPIQLQSLFAEMREAHVTDAAIEVSSIALDQDRVWGTMFSVGLFTNLTQDHLDYHGDFENYYQAKLRFFSDYGVPVALFNGDSPWGRRMKAESHVERALTFALWDSQADYVATIRDLGKGGTRLYVRGPQGAVEFSTPLVGEHNVYNLLGAIAVCVELGTPIERVAKVAALATGAPGRLERVRVGNGGPYVYVDYAHTPDALENVLRCLTALRGEGGRGRIITVFGCGGDRDRSKRPQMAQAVAAQSDVIIATSDNPRTEDPDQILDDVEKGLPTPKSNYHRQRDRRSAIGMALRLASKEDIVLVAGKGHETYQIIGTEQFPFDDRVIIRDYYQSNQGR
jgi:UDP-N-acetylmuramoyl-L-alanyl-D-glutamate--2,6-diaminopimelate ligase